MTQWNFWKISRTHWLKLQDRAIKLDINNVCLTLTQKHATGRALPRETGSLAWSHRIFLSEQQALTD